MNKLLWKEWHERKWWILLWTIAVIILAAVHQGQAIFPDTGAFSWWSLLPTSSALLCGLSAYSSETTGERTTFIYSRPIHWGQLLLSKCILGVFPAVLAPLLGIVAIYLTIPSPYARFLSLPDLLNNGLQYTLPITVAYLAGVTCSVALSGLAGSMLSALIALVILAIGETIVSQFSIEPFYIIYSLFLGTVIAAILLSRFGMTLSPMVRLRRFICIVSLAVVLGIILDLTPLTKTWQPEQSTMERKMRISLSGENAYVSTEEFVPIQNAEYTINEMTTARDVRWIQVATGHAYAQPNHVYIAWAPGDYLFTSEGKGKDLVSYINWWEKDRPYSMALNINKYFAYDDISTSPDGKRILFTASESINVFDKRTSQLRLLLNREFINRFSTEQKKAFYSFYRYCWWQANDTIGYFDPITGKRQFMKID